MSSTGHQTRQNLKQSTVTPLAPPPYATVSSAPTLSSLPVSDDELAGLRGYDVVYIVDDSSSMSWEESVSKIIPWPHARDALITFSTLCAQWDEDGQDVYFLNRNEPVLNATPQQIAEVFNLTLPNGGTNMGARLAKIARAYFEEYDAGEVKPMNIIAITDGQFSDDVISVIKWIVVQLDKRDALPNQIGIQFVQIGADRAATKCLQMLDDDLEDMGLSRDIVDTVPWSPRKVDGPGFDGKYLIKVVCGAINKKIDNQGRRKKGTKGTEKPQKKKSMLRRMFS
ncbi:CIC11C00000005481 [Sungouiella intermedia]|uniref:CIC11C00000004203 n=1 Tax=Sungouiella intermedia TaxID=45354 RepID=A0A1L0BMV8_9ASCO|nr:CIC11C00000005481 [[Candida] intermedia]SGZ52414.1 CIC11C00000004203 [[Candida] intermedia]